MGNEELEDLSPGECVVASDGYAYCNVNGKSKRFKIKKLEELGD